MYENKCSGVTAVLCTPFIRFSGLLTCFNDLTNVMPKVGSLQWVNNGVDDVHFSKERHRCFCLPFVIDLIKMFQVTGM
jgi:hypothetical protein